MKKKWTFQQKRSQNTCLFQKLRYQDLQKNVDFEAIENLFINMRNHFVCGKGSSGLAAREMRLRFMRIGVDINSIQDPDLMRMQAVFQKEGCLVIGISISGESEDVCYLLEESKKRGADTILITGKNKDDYEDICDELVLIASRKYLDHGNVISPQFPILIMLDLIYSYYLEHDKKKKETMHDDTVRALKGEKS